MRDGHGVHVPPKELNVLRLLLGSAGTVISKDYLLDRVWPDTDAAEESLTRCIYALRKLLKDNKDFIVTVYGQGYRFTCPVVTLALAEPAPSTVPSLAVLPFRGMAEPQVLDLQDAMIRQLATAFGEALRVVPSGLMAACGQPIDARRLVERLLPDFYLTGRFTQHNVEQRWSIELIRGGDHGLLHAQTLCAQDVGEALGELTCLVAQRLPGLRPSGDACSSYPALVAYLNGLCNVQRHTPQRLRDALVQFRHSLQLDDRYGPSWCGVVDVWLGQAMLGVCDPGHAIDEAHTAISRALSLDPGSAPALARLALLTSLRGCDEAAQALFRRCLLTADQADVHYLYAWHHWFWRRTGLAVQSIERCLQHDADCVRANILRVRIALAGDPRDALTLARQTLQQGASGHPLLVILHAVVLAYFGQHAAAWYELDQAGLSERAMGEQGLAAWNVLFGANPLTARNQYAHWLQLARHRSVQARFAACGSGLPDGAVVAPLWRTLHRSTPGMQHGASVDSGRRLA
ncbi:winged helix-turn-helix domain-containing protein [Pseudomonas sp. 14P_8.1_Bac3]|uniref:winged helix-turn-helix domain-containing protein n=1 Tax=Pseudomonas sp. 14P_8.1_Bac3 TaxID=2971621 RepID=UPI0021C7FC25|nr:winged helix-turn-helix domain-containing protein [Pseudomonas sp. 14P_8.1_Bac3]MCU1761466.1 winged helix-turn-helix domain-containing protein [Pseudomonas sp. 14P_8.1_Bac3]